MIKIPVYAHVGKIVDADGEMLCLFTRDQDTAPFALAEIINAHADVAELVGAAEFYQHWASTVMIHANDKVDEANKHAAAIERWRKQVRGSRADETSKKG